MWNRIGSIRRKNSGDLRLLTHMAVPIVETLQFPQCRLYFSARDQHNQSRTFSAEFDITNLERGFTSEPILVLYLGELGTFDDSGAMATCLVTRGIDRYLYYQGWNLGVTVPFRNSIGLAISVAGKPFEKTGPGPLLDRCYEEPHFVATPTVVPSKTIWRMWYLSCTSWERGINGPCHRYHIKSSTSSDGVRWVRPGNIAIDFGDQDEYAISRPSVLYEDSLWRMWFSHRGKSYKIGYAESLDAVTWVRDDSKSGLAPDGREMEVEMVEYPCVFRFGGELYMAYSGDSYGRDGVLFAKWQQ